MGKKRRKSGKSQNPNDICLYFDVFWIYLFGMVGKVGLGVHIAFQQWLNAGTSENWVVFQEESVSGAAP